MTKLLTVRVIFTTVRFLIVGLCIVTLGYAFMAAVPWWVQGFMVIVLMFCFHFLLLGFNQMRGGEAA